MKIIENCPSWLKAHEPTAEFVTGITNYCDPTLRSQYNLVVFLLFVCLAVIGAYFVRREYLYRIKARKSLRRKAKRLIARKIPLFQAQSTLAKHWSAIMIAKHKNSYPSVVATEYLRRAKKGLSDKPSWFARMIKKIKRLTQKATTDHEYMIPAE